MYLGQSDESKWDNSGGSGCEDRGSVGAKTTKGWKLLLIYI